MAPNVRYHSSALNRVQPANYIRTAFVQRDELRKTWRRSEVNEWQVAGSGLAALNGLLWVQTESELTGQRMCHLGRYKALSRSECRKRSVVEVLGCDCAVRASNNLHDRTIQRLVHRTTCWLQALPVAARKRA